jgi:hypothetical protein
VTSPLRLTTSNFIFQLNTCGYSPYVTSSLMRGWVCRLQLLLVLASAVILRSESHGTHDHILLSQIQDSPNLEIQVPVFISPRNRVAWLYPWHWVSSLSTPTTHRATVDVFDPASTWDDTNTKQDLLTKHNTSHLRELRQTLNSLKKPHTWGLAPMSMHYFMAIVIKIRVLSNRSHH